MRASQDSKSRTSSSHRQDALQNPQIVEAQHQDWTGDVHLDPATRRATLAMNGSCGSYVLADDVLEITWDLYPADRFRLNQGRYVQIGHDDRQEIPKTIRAETPGSPFIAELRTEGGDLATYRHVFVANAYDVADLPDQAATIVDIGAGIGLASLFFAAKYSSASIMSVEADADRYSRLTRHVSQLGQRSTALRAAVGSEDVVGRPESTIWSLPRLCRDFRLSQIDILKIDIDRVGPALFDSADLGWLDRVDSLLLDVAGALDESIAAKLASKGFSPRLASSQNGLLTFGRGEARATTPEPTVAVNPILLEILQTGKVYDGAEGIALHSNMSGLEGGLITQAFTGVKAKTSLEIGCAYGVSALFACDSLAANFPDGGAHHTVVDPFQSTQWRGIGMKNLAKAGYGDLVSLVEEPSEYALPRLAASGLKIDAAIIDGWHTLDHTLIDLFYVNRMLRVGGVIVLDDTQFPAVNKILRYFLTYPAYRLTACASVPAPMAQLASTLIKRDSQSAFGEARPDWKHVPADVFGSAVALKKVGTDDRDWNWYGDF